jgi:hypothetical protein
VLAVHVGSPWDSRACRPLLDVILHPTRPVLRASEGCDDVARSWRFQCPPAADQLECSSVLRNAARSYRPTSDLARMLVWISDVPPMMENARELR